MFGLSAKEAEDMRKRRKDEKLFALVVEAHAGPTALVPALVLTA